MNTSLTGVTSDIHNPILQLIGERAGGTSAANAARLERVRADRALILADLEPSVPSFPRLSSRVGSGIVVDAMELPSIGYGAEDDDAIDAEGTAVGGTTRDGDASEVGGATSDDDAAEIGGADDPAGGEGIAAQGIAASTVTKRELAFLDDKSLTIEEKLFRFMALMTKKSDQDLVAYMKEISGNGTKTSSSGSSSSGSGSSTSTGDSSSANGSSDASSAGGSGPADGSGASSTENPGAIPGLPPPYTGMNLAQLHEKLDVWQILNLVQRGDPNAYAGFFSAVDKVGPVLAQGVAWAAHEFAGPALGAAVTAFGLPELAPIANSLGSEVGDLVGNGVKGLIGGGSGANSASRSVAGEAATNGLAAGGSDGVTGDVPTVAKATSSSSSATASAVDEKLQIFNLQRLVEKQEAMFTALSNILKSLHSARMAAVQNLR